MLARELKKKYLEFFKSKGHAIIHSASLIPENDPSVLFTTAGMHPLIPHLLGEEHPEGKRLANCQKCLRTDDIDYVGDEMHLTFFEMLGNWSLGDYFKKEAITWSYEFLTKHLNIDPEKLHVTVFAGDNEIPRDEESAEIWRSLGIPEERIHFLPRKDNFWGPVGETGPCGPCTEMFIDTGKPPCSEDCKPGCACGKYFEIWNDVFMEYNRTKDGRFEKLKQHNVDTGMGVERTVAILQGKKSVYETEVFMPIMKKIDELKKNSDIRAERIIADHIKAATFILGDQNGVVPSNKDQGYVLRRLIRRAIRFARQLGIEKEFCSELAKIVIDIYKDDYPELELNKDIIITELNKEEERFSKVLEAGLKQFNKMLKKGTITGKDAFILFSSFGFPFEMTKELAKEHGIIINEAEFQEEFKKHQELSRTAAKQKFKSGLIDESYECAKLHTATHLLHAALRKVLGEKVRQMGSNITPERLRFDFSFDRKLTEDELKKVEDLVNQKIQEGLPVIKKIMSLEEAQAEGALAFFGHRYGDKVSVYDIPGFSKEVCAGPHVKNTKELGRFKIIKEEGVSAGVRRIKAILEKV